MIRLRCLIDRIPDAVWPHLTGDPDPEPEPADPIAITDDALLAAAEAALSRQLDEEDGRFDSVNARLLPMLALASVIATALTLGVPFALSGDFAEVGTLELSFVLVILIYIVFQIVFCLRAAVMGLSRRGYRTMASNQLDPLPGESPLDYRLRLHNEKRSIVIQNAWANNQKVSDMALAHEAFENILRGVAVLIIASALIAMIGDVDPGSPVTVEPTPVERLTPTP